MNTQSNSFFEQVYAVVRTIPRGKVCTYGQIAKSLGSRDARTVGWALNNNPYQGEVPCHRVVNKQGRVAPGFAFGGADVQRSMLESEGVEFDEQGLVQAKYILKKL